MADPSSIDNPIRVAIVGSGPAGFYTVAALLKQQALAFEIDMFDRLPTPFGLIRAGVAPDHQKDKSVTRAYDKSARNANFRFYGSVAYGSDIHLRDLQEYYHQIVFCTGAQTDRSLGIAGEDLDGSHSATDFVAWYNGHPDYAHLHFDLTRSNVAVIGLGNVAVDVARILCKSHEELRRTDIADYALEALGSSHVRNVYMLGRRGPAQAAFSPSEIEELGALADADVTVPAEEARLDPLSREELERAADNTATRNVIKNVQAVEKFAARVPRGGRKLLTIRFLVSPVEIIGDAGGHVQALRLAQNAMIRAADGTLRPRPTGVEEQLPVGLVFRSVGYQGVAFGDLPFDDDRAVIRNDHGRITATDGVAIPGLYVAGWIKRGPTGVIGTNKTDAQETVTRMVEDLAAGRCLRPRHPQVEMARAFIHSRAPRSISYGDWGAIDAFEVARGAQAERPRVKLTSIEDMHAVLAARRAPPNDD